MTERLQFFTINGFQSSVKKSLDCAIALINTAETVGVWSKSYLPMLNDSVSYLIHAHNILVKVTDQGAEIKEDEAMLNVNAGRLREAATRYALSEVDYVKGAVADPYLYAADEAFQQNAVMGLRKARKILADRIEYLTTAGA